MRLIPEEISFAMTIDEILVLEKLLGKMTPNQITYDFGMTVEENIMLDNIYECLYKYKSKED